MNYLISLILLMGLAHAQLTSAEEFEVGAPKDCLSLGSSEVQGDSTDQMELQKQIMDCLGPDEDFKPVEIKQTKHHEVVSQ